MQLRCSGRGPREAVETRIEVVGRRLREVMQQVVGEIAPAQLPQIAVDVGVSAGTAQSLQRMRDAPRCDLAEMQMRRQPRGADPVRQVTLLAVTAQRAVLEHGQRLQRAGLARLPVLPEAGIPVQRGRQPQLVQCEAVDRVRGQCLRRGTQRRQAPMTEYVAPVRSEHLVRLTLLCRDVPGLEQQAAIAALCVDALLAQRAFDGGVACLGGRLVLAVPVHRLGAGLPDQQLQGRQAVTTTQHQRRTARAQVGVQGTQ